MASKILTNFQHKSLLKIPLRFVLLVPFLLILVIAVGATSYIAFVNGQNAVNDVARQLRSEVSARIEDHLQRFLQVPHATNQQNILSIQQGWLNTNNTEILQFYFLEQVKTHPSITSIYFGNADGGIVGSGREGADGSLYVYSTEAMKAGAFNKYAVDSAGEMGNLLLSIPNFDARTRPWYGGAVQKGTATWNNIYIPFTGQDMAISASSPVYDEQHRLLGVVSVDIFLSQIENFLQTLKISKSGQSFIMERSGLLVASSAAEKPFTQVNGELERIDARNSQMPIVKASAEFLRERFGENYAVIGAEQFDFEIEGERYFLNVSPVRDPYGIDWLVVVVIPESDFMAEIIKTNLMTVLVSLVALAFSILLSDFIAQKIASRISDINQTAQAFISGGESTLVLGNSRIKEIDELTVFFAEMKFQLSQTLNDLHTEINTRKQSEEAVEQIRKNYETFFNSIDNFLFVLDEQGNIIHTNQTVTVRLGYSLAELLGNSVLMVHPPERREEAGRIVGEMLAGAAEFCPVPIMAKSGEQIPVETRVTSGFWDGKPAIFGVTKDISQIKLSEEKFSKAFQSNPTLMALSRLEDGAYIDVNAVFLETLGFTRDEVIGKTSTKLGLFVDADQRNQTIEKIKQAGAVKDIEVTVRTKDGLNRYGLFSADSVYIGEDLCLLTVMVDITERKQAEEALRESQSLYHSLVEVSPLSICRKDLAGRFTFANRRFLELSQITLTDLVGKTDFDLHPSELAEKYRRDDKAIIDSGQVQELIEERIIIGDESIMVQSIKTPIYDGTGKVNGIQISFWDITERKRAEKALKESEERLREVLENSLDASYKRDLRTNAYDYFSPVSERIFGYTQDEMKTLPIDSVLDLMHPDDAPQLERVLAQAMSDSGGTSWQTEYRFKHKDGQYRWLHDQFTVMRDGQNQPVALIGSVGDITERKQMEEALRQSEEKYRSVANFTYDWEAWYAPDGAYIYISPSCERISGYTAAQFLSNPNLVVEIAHPDDREKVAEHFDMAFHHCREQDMRLDFRIITLGGETRWISHHCTAIYSEGGHCLGRRESNRDITERKQMENELQAQRDFATQIINAMGQGLTVTDAEGRFEFVNQAYARLFGYEAADLIGKYPADVTAPEDRATLIVQKALRQAGKTSTYESRLHRPDGSAALVLITGVPRERNGKYSGAIAVITDLTEQKRVEDELRHARDELELANQKLEQALAREQKLARTDSLTGVTSRGALFELAERKFNVALRYRLPFSIMLFDIDHFKQINDTFGHAVGDQALRRITQVVCEQIRAADVIGRYGGDEFVILLPQSSVQEAANLAVRIHASIADICMNTERGTHTLTISLGISQMIHKTGQTTGVDTLEALFLRADQALYAAKQAGRNRTVISEE